MRNNRLANQNSCRDAGCNGCPAQQHPDPSTAGGQQNISWNAFGTLAVLTNTVASFYCCDSKVQLAHAEAEIQNKNVQILQMAEMQQKLVECQNTGTIAADAKLRHAQAELASAKREHDAEKENSKKEKAALERRESRAKASSEKAKEQLKEANELLKETRAPGAGQPSGRDDVAGESHVNNVCLLTTCGSTCSRSTGE